MDETLRDSEDPRELRWVEKWAVQTDIWDERLGDELVDED